jgi:peptidoglycan/LPS O-acetylase OafA/YrhL
VVIGITSLITFSNNSLFSVTYFRRRFERIIFPFLLIFLVVLVEVGIITVGKAYYPKLANLEIYWGWQIAIGLLPYSGPGNYFVTIMLQFIFLAPLIMWLYRKSPVAMLVTLFGIDLAFEFAAPHIFAGNDYLYRACIFRYFAAIALGLWIGNEFLTTGRVSFWSKRSALIWFLLPLSLWYLFEAQYIKQPFSLFKPEWSSQNIISYAYVALLVILLIKAWQYLSKINLTPILRLGNASYHIFLVQILYFTSIAYIYAPSSLVLRLIVNIVACCALGLAFQAVEQRILRMLKTAFASRAG